MNKQCPPTHVRGYIHPKLDSKERYWASPSIRSKLKKLSRGIMRAVYKRNLTKDINNG